jgi:hypothetical protein
LIGQKNLDNGLIASSFVILNYSAGEYFVERKASLAPRRIGPRSRVDDFYDHPAQIILEGAVALEGGSPFLFSINQSAITAAKTGRLVVATRFYINLPGGGAVPITSWPFTFRSAPVIYGK